MFHSSTRQPSRTQQICSSVCVLLLSVFPFFYVSIHILAKKKRFFIFLLRVARHYRIYQQTKDISVFCLRFSNGNGVVCTKDWTDMNMGIMRVILISWGAFVIKLHFYSNTLFNKECRVLCYAITAGGIITLSRVAWFA